MRTTTMRHLCRWLLSGVLLLSLASCTNDDDIDDFAYTDGMVAVEMNIQARALSESIYSNYETYVPGTEWENYVDFNGGDYRIYFFTYNPDNTSDEETNNTLIASFTPSDIFSTDLDTYTTYTLSGELDEETVAKLDDFKVVVVANWGKENYPTESDIAEGLTIDQLCSYEKAVFNAFVDNGTALMPSSSLHIPFFGLREYSGVTWKEGTMTRLNGDITLLRSVAKVEVILEPSDDQEDISFSNVSIVNYNATGYCAPTGVYLRGDYDHDGDWETDFVDGLHLVNDGKNDEGQDGTNTIAMYKTTNSDGYETWVAYVPEYNNIGTDFSYISLLADFQLTNDPYTVYFANYTEGGTTAYDADGNASDRYNIYRNYLYRYHVTIQNSHLRVFVNWWNDAFDNEWTFGDMDIGQVLGGGDRFLVDNYWEYEVTSSEDREVAITYNTSEEGSVTNYSGSIVIPETVSYNGVNYTVTAIGEECFYGGTGITSVTIPSTISEIGEKAFYNCTGLTEITCLATTPPECEKDAFSGVLTGTCILYVPEESLNDYQSTSPWSDFTNIEAVSEAP